MKKLTSRASNWVIPGIALILSNAPLPAMAQDSGMLSQEAKRAITELSRAAQKDIPKIREAIASGDYAEADRLARVGLSIMPKNNRLLGFQAEALLRAGRSAEALAVLNEFSEAGRRGQWHARVALLKFRLGNKQESLRLAQVGFVESLLSTHLKGEYPEPKLATEVEAYWLFAIGLQENEDMNREYYFLASQRLKPQPVALNACLGRVLSAHKRYEQAIVCFDIVIANSKNEQFVRAVRQNRASAAGQLQRARGNGIIPREVTGPANH